MKNNKTNKIVKKGEEGGKEAGNEKGGCPAQNSVNLLYDLL